MFDENTPMTFQALLKTREGDVLAEGLAHIREETRDVDFTADFVPLFPLGTPLEIVRVEEDREIHRFEGNVYLSSRTLLRLVSVIDFMPDDPDRYYCTGLPFTGIFHLLAEETKKPFFSFHKKAKTETPIDVTAPIVSLSETRLIFLYDSKFPFFKGQRLLLNADMPLLLPQAELEIIDAFLFGVNSSYTCRFVGLPPEDKKNLRYFLLEYSLNRQRKAQEEEVNAFRPL
ncbi:hypothetical protein [Acidaminobacterium chupaoyuni]|mgnify:CR=1 FL=1